MVIECEYLTAINCRKMHPCHKLFALPIMDRPRDRLYDSKKGDKKTMRAALTLRKERAHKNEAMLDAAFGDPSFLP